MYNVLYRGILCSMILGESYEQFEDTKGVILIRKSKKDTQQNGQKKKDKQQSTKHYTES